MIRFLLNPDNRGGVLHWNEKNEQLCAGCFKQVEGGFVFDRNAYFCAERRRAFHFHCLPGHVGFYVFSHGRQHEDVPITAVKCDNLIIQKFGVLEEKR